MSRPPPISATALSMTSRLRSPRKSTLRSPSASTFFIENCVTSSESAPFCWSGTTSISGSEPITTPAAWIESARVRPSSGRARSTISFATGSLSTAFASSWPGLERVLERLARAFRDELRDAVDDAVGDLEHAAGVAERGAGGHLREGDDLRDAVAAVLLGDVVDDALPALDREVDVHVGHVLAGRVEEPLEEEAVAHGVDVGDLEAVGGERAGRRAAARADRDAVSLREADEVGDDQEVVREAHLADGLELEAQPLVELRGRGAVALDEALLAQLDEVVERVAAFRHGEARQPDPAELELDVAALGDLEAAAHGVLVSGEVERHLGRGLEVELLGAEAPAVRVLERVAGLDAEKRVVAVRVGRFEVVDVSGGDELEAAPLGELREAAEGGLLHVEPDVLQLDVRVVRAEDLRQPVELGLGVAVAALGERPRDAAGEAAREGDHPRREALEQLPVDARLVVVALEVAERAELDQVRVAGVVGGEERQVRVALRERAAIVDDVHLAAEDRLDPLLGGGLVEVDRAGHRAVVGERHGGHLELGRLPRERRDPARPVEDRVLGVDVQVDERGGHGRAIVVGRSAGQARPFSPMSGRCALSRCARACAGPGVELDLPRGDPGLDKRAGAPITRACGRSRSHSSSWQR